MKTTENLMNLTEFVIDPKVCTEIDAWVAKYPPQQQRSAVITALLLVQKQNQGWLSEAAMNAVANYLNLAPIEVYEVASFYDMYELKPAGRHKINICTNLSCTLRGAEQLVDCVKKRLGIGFGETTVDKQFTLREAECLAACGGAPVCQIDDQHYHENLTPAQLEALIDQLQQENS